jgi:single-stranded DNA-binding protein
MAILKKVEIWFTKLDPKRPNARFDKDNPTWELQLRTTDRAVKKEWEAHGLPVKAVVPDEEDAVPFFRVNLKKRSLKKDKKTGEMVDNEPVEVFDAKLKPIDPRTIGNKSIGNVRIYQYDKKDGSGKASILMGVQLTKHIVYEPKVGESFDELEEETEMEAAAPQDEGFAEEDEGTTEESDTPSPSPSPSPSAPKTPAPGSTSLDLDDEIPF